MKPIKRGSNASCENCSQKFKVFARKKVCLTCQMAVCKNCFPQHVQSHRVASNNCFNNSPRMLLPKMQSASALQSSARHLSSSFVHQHQHPASHASRASASAIMAEELEQEDVYFLSPDHARGSARHFDFDLSEPNVLDDLEGVEMVETEDEDEDDEEHNDRVDDEEEEEEEGDEEEEGEDAFDDGDDFLQVHAYSKGFASVHEQRRQQREFLFLQDIVAKWAQAEKNIQSQYDQSKRCSCFTLEPIGRGIKATRRLHMERVSSIVYAVVVTLSVWVLGACSWWLYQRFSTTLLSPVYEW